MPSLRDVWKKYAVLAVLSVTVLFCGSYISIPPTYYNRPFYNIITSTDIHPGSDSNTSRDAVYGARSQRLEDFCRDRFGLEPSSPMSVSKLRPHLTRFMLVDEKHKVLYCEVPKAGSSTWKALLVRENYENYNSSKPWENFAIHNGRKLERIGIHHLASYSDADIHRILSTYFKFLSVRHPLARLVSGYRDKFLTSLDYKTHMRPYVVERFRKGNKEKPMSFYAQRNFHILQYKNQGITINEEFLEGRTNDELLDEYESFMPPYRDGSPFEVTFDEFLQFAAEDNDHHWMTYQNLCRPCLIQYDVITRTESLDGDSRDIMSVMNRTFPLRTKSIGHVRVMSNTNQTAIRNGCDPKELSEYTTVQTSTLQAVLDKYSDDMAGFGYTYEQQNSVAGCRI